MLFTVDHLVKISKSLSRPNDNMESVIIGLRLLGEESGLVKASRLPHFLAQLAHESGGFRYDRELWGPTPAQKRYEGRKDLGNTQPGDGSKYRGHGPIQITGRDNTTAFYKWCRERFDSVPNFIERPELIVTDPWEGISPIWFWMKNDLNYYADQNNLLALTRKINGGTNGLQDRQEFYTRSALVLLGYGATQVKEFQKDAGFIDRDLDGIAGQKTWTAMHRQLQSLPDFWFTPKTPDGSADAMALLAEAETLVSRLESLIQTLKGE